ncbi:MAG: CRISPR-associated protein Cas4 [Fervidobacterium sp.]|nr:CRISPR-associated protein Cas4 [Fervidobacterium sp.]
MVDKIEIQPNWLYSYLVCQREAWLIAHGIEGEQNNIYLELGRLIHEETYSRYKHEQIVMPSVKIDLFYENKKTKIIGEIKSSSKRLKEAKLQLLYYCYILKQKGVEFSAELLIPKERKRIKVELTDESIQQINKLVIEVKELIELPRPPQQIRQSACTKCAYEKFCWTE